MDHEVLGNKPTPDMPAPQAELTPIASSRLRRIAAAAGRGLKEVFGELAAPSTKEERTASQYTTLARFGMDPDEVDRLNSQN